MRVGRSYILPAGEPAANGYAIVAAHVNGKQYKAANPTTIAPGEGLVYYSSQGGFSEYNESPYS